jgi:hypothetical protein
MKQLASQPGRINGPDERLNFMTVTQRGSSNRYLDRPSPSSLADVLDTILDKGLVIDIYVRVSLVGIELLTIDARIVIASVDTYLRFAEAVNRLDLTETGPKQFPELIGDVTEGAAKRKTSGAIDGVLDRVGEVFSRDDEDEDEDDRRRRQPAKKSTSSRRRESQPE